MARLTTVVVATARQRALCRSLLAPTDGCSIVGEGRTVVEALELTARLQPAILLLGSPHGRTAPPLALSLIRSRSPRTRIILLTERASEADILDALSQGALGYLAKDGLPTSLARAVRAVAAGEAWVSRRMVGRIIDRLAHLPAKA